jgi:hypothetical protein
MREFEQLLIDRRLEVEKHHRFVEELQSSSINRAGRGPVDFEHINIVKSAFLVHLYNVIESVMSKIVEAIATDTSRHQPLSWHDQYFLAWVTHRASLENELAPADRLVRVVNVIAEAAGRRAVGSTHVSKREGNWSHAEVAAFAEKLGCVLTIADDVRNRACVRNFQNDMPPIKYVRHMRNQLAHGNLSFVDASSALSVDQLGELRDAVMDYAAAVVGSFKAYLESQKYLRPALA